MTEAAFLDWITRSEEIRAEWVEGKVVNLPPVELSHARIVSFLHALLRNYADERDLGEVLGEPYQIRFAKIRRRRMPDLMFISNANLRHLQRMQFEGPPDLIVEVLSADSKTHDQREKFLEYQQMGVREY